MCPHAVPALPRQTAAMDVDEESRVEGLLDRLTLSEKVSLLAGSDVWHLPPVERLGIGSLRMSDGPAGVRGTQVSAGPPSLNVPCGSALAATWEPDLIESVGRVLGEECRRKGAHVLLGPTVNLHRTPTGGRNFECLSEDPYLTGRLAVAYVRGVQSVGVAACTKHLVANDTETDRFTVSAEVDERALRELYLVPFEAALVEAGSWSVMGAYNRLGGTYCCEHPWLLGELLADEWGWDGAVISDWMATHSTAAPVSAGLDVEMPGPTLWRGDSLVAAVSSGEVSIESLDERVRRVLRLLARTARLAPEGDAAPPLEPERAGGDLPAREVARRAAAAAIVVLRNDPPGGATTPLLPVAAGPDGPRRIAVVGPNADAATVQGGGSAQVSPSALVTVLEGIRARFADAEVIHEPGVRTPRGTPALDIRSVRTPDGEVGFLVEHVGGPDPDGEVVVTQVARRARLVWWGPPSGIDDGAWSLRATGELTADTTGRHRLEVRANAAVRARVDGRVVVDAWASAEPSRHPVELDLVAGEPVRLELDVRPSSGALTFTGVDLRLVAPDSGDRVERAVEAASRADLAVVVVGMDHDWETEGRDRDGFGLPDGQDQLVAAVCTANPNTVVVVNAGSPIAMPWAEQAPAVVWLWYPGQEGGTALAEVLAGDVDPSGRLPVTIPERLEDTPAFLHHPGERGVERYGEGIFIGYRWYDTRALPVRYPFGFGLSYTQFRYGDVAASVEAASTADPRVRVTVPVTNVGSRPGAEVVQVYVSHPGATVKRPAKELRGFRKVWAAPGETVEVVVDLGARAFAFWDPATGGWLVEPGRYDVVVGSSAADIRATVPVVLGPADP